MSYFHIKYRCLALLHYIEDLGPTYFQVVDVNDP